MTENNKFNEELIQEGVRKIIEGIGDNPDRDGVIGTPKRVADMYKKILDGNVNKDISKYVKLFDEQSRGNIVVVKNVPFYSFCEHHIIPFFGKIAIAYVPKDDKVLGLSKLVRIARVFAKRLQVQERLTKEIVEAIDKNIPNSGVAVRFEAEHLCMSIRGVCTPGATTTTQEMTGLFKTDSKYREDFMEVLK